MTRLRKAYLTALAVVLLMAAPARSHPGHAVIAEPAGRTGPPSAGTIADRRWLAGDHHVHSWYSTGWTPGKSPQDAPTPVIGGDGVNPITTNARMAARFGLQWLVATDHGGPNHAALNRAKAYPELVRSRKLTPQVLQFWGLEMNTPAAEHNSVIVPHAAGEEKALFDIERRFDRREAWPEDPARDAEPFMLEALGAMRQLPQPPVVIANHPSRTADPDGRNGDVSPAELRAWNDAAPDVAVGMEGAPGHQAATLRGDGPRGAYARSPSFGGFDPMTARVGGFWDSMLGEGRRWWITATSDSHRHYTDGGEDFWPGEYSKTYVWAARTYGDILDGLRRGRVFVTLGDLVSEVDVTVQEAGGGRRAGIGETVRVRRGSDVTIIIRVRDPSGANFAGRRPAVGRVDLVQGDVTGPAQDRGLATNPTARVIRRFGPQDWAVDGERLSMIHVLHNVQRSGYIRIRGTNTTELEPQPDVRGEDPWSDLWFYANPVFIEVTPGPGSAGSP